jgi:hypothetical protein
MPAYQVIIPIQALYPGQVGLSFGTQDPRQGQMAPVVGEALADGAGAQFALHAVPQSAKGPGIVTWEVSYPSAPSGATAELQGALVDADAEYATIDSTTSLGDLRVVEGIGAFKFLRIKLASTSGPGTVIARIAVS